IFNVGRKKKEKVARLLKMHANKKERIEIAYAGDIVGVIGLKETITGDTISSEAHPILLEAIDCYEPVISQAIEAKSPADQEKLDFALKKLLEEDPTLRVASDEETAQNIISGMGELHLEIVVDRLQREFGARVNVGKPRVMFRETVQNEATVQGVFEREIGDRKHFGDVLLVVAPRGRSQGNLVESALPEGSPLLPFLPAIMDGINEGIASGVIAGYPVVDIGVRIVGGNFREGESSVIGYKIAALTALRESCQKAEPVMLEPMMKVIVTCPAEFTGDVISDVNSRRGEVQALDSHNLTTKIEAKVPLKALFGYSTDIRSLTQGRAVFSMQFLMYDRS
ncbi:MAG: elongation factor G, partial [Deltaproteobacteria bacterium]|nr:elongation factor G [Deltaproteobacteria bacterium]